MIQNDKNHLDFQDFGTDPFKHWCSLVSVPSVFWATDGQHWELRGRQAAEGLDKCRLDIQVFLFLLLVFRTPVLMWSAVPNITNQPTTCKKQNMKTEGQTSELNFDL